MALASRWFVRRRLRWLPLLWPLLSLSLLLYADGARALDPGASPAAALRERFALLGEPAAAQATDLPIRVESTESADRLEGSVYARIEPAFDRARAVLAGPQQWCDILILHLNVKYCRAETAAAGDVLHVAVGRKFDQPLERASWARFELRTARSLADYLQVMLEAPDGPMGTHDYRIVVELAAGSGSGSIVHMTYSYRYGAAAGWVMQAYLATLGRDKVGFSVVGRRADGQPVRVRGVRGVVERNAMRYYLAIEAVLGVQALAPAQRMPSSLELWFDATERYPEQLHEIGRTEYLEMKRRELQRQATQAPPRLP